MKQPYPRITLAPREPSTTYKLRSWVKRFGISRLSRALGINRSAVHSWITPAGVSHPPELPNALRIVALSKIEPLPGRSGALTLEDVYGEANAATVEMVGSA